ncbi:MAG TPA: hypothetical protein DCQ06_00455 [Myxococcales bacterium]|nr:hypothetical protein [Myxococcales bacterium]
MSTPTDTEFEELLREAGLNSEAMDRELQDPGYLTEHAHVQALFDVTAAQSSRRSKPRRVVRRAWFMAALAASLLLAIGASQWRVNPSPATTGEGWAQQQDASGTAVIAVADDDDFIEMEFDEAQQGLGDPWGLAFDDDYGVDWSGEGWLEEGG